MKTQKTERTHRTLKPVLSVDKAFETIKNIFSNHIKNAYLETGEYLIKTFYGGDIENARNKKPVEKESFHQLALKFAAPAKGAPSKTFLYDSVRLYIEEHDLGSFQTFGKLSTSQKLLLLPIRNIERKKELITDAVDNELSVIELKEKVALARKQEKKPAKIKKSGKAVSGTKEWAVKEISCCTGCPNDCRYCYARYNATKRSKQVSEGDWSELKIRQKDVLKRYKKYEGTVMFPTTHDIVPENLYACIIVLESLLSAGNKVLIVSKPWMECIEPICNYFRKYKKQILFRFTIGSTDDDILSFWEPNAPSYQERKQCLEYAFKKGFKTSVSCEPMLDAEKINDLVDGSLPFITDALWIGKMNKIESRVAPDDKETEAAVEKIVADQMDDKVTGIYDRYKDNPKIKWKESIKVVVGLERPSESGLDI